MTDDISNIFGKQFLFGYMCSIKIDTQRNKNDK